LFKKQLLTHVKLRCKVWNWQNNKKPINYYYVIKNFILGSFSKKFHLHIILAETQQRTITCKYNYNNMDKAMYLGWGKLFFTCTTAWREYSRIDRAPYGTTMPCYDGGVLHYPGGETSRTKTVRIKNIK